MFSKFSNETVVLEHVRELGLGMTFLAAVAEVCSTPTLIGWLDGRVTLDRSKQERLVSVCRSLKRHADSLKPFPVSFATANAVQWHIILDRESRQTPIQTALRIREAAETFKNEQTALPVDGLQGEPRSGNEVPVAPIAETVPETVTK